MVVWMLVGFFVGVIIGSSIYSQSHEGVIQLTFIYSSEKASWIGETQAEFEVYWAEKMEANASLKPIRLNFQPYGSGSSLIALLNGEIKPTIWSPASNLWIPLLNTKWHEITNSEVPIVTSFERFIYSPVVLTVWEDFQAEHNIKGLNDLHDLIQANPGLVKLAHTDPRTSNSGFMATIMMVVSNLGLSPEDITLDAISQQELIDWMRTVESAAVQYGESTGFLGRYMRDNGPGALNAVFLYENLVQDYSSRAAENFGQRMIAIYPEEGALFSDHPFCLIDADWVTPEQRMAAEEYIRFMNRKEIIMKAIGTGFRPIDTSLLEMPDVFEIYNQSFREEFGVTSDPGIIRELLPPTDGVVISRLPDLWLMTRATSTRQMG